MKKKKVAIQGISGSFHDEAAKKYFGEDIAIVECETFKTECEALSKKETDYAVMAIENTIAGSMLPNYALLRDYHLKIIGEVFLHIKMNLMVLQEVKFEDIKYIHSHPIAIRQCEEYLSDLTDVTILEKNDTADSAKEIKEKSVRNAAAIAGENAAKIYGLTILEKRIETHKKNYTRFLVLGLEGINLPENNKATICFETGHHVGALSNVLNIFTSNSINLTKIQSIPIIGKPYEYTFHLDLEWNNSDNFEKAIREVLRATSNLSVLGEYKKGELHLNGNIDKWVNV